MKGIYASFIFLVLISATCLSADLEFTPVVDAGDVNVRFMDYKPEGNNPKLIHYKDSLIKIRNISNEIIYINSSVKHDLYDKKIIKKGNYITASLNPKCLFPNDSVYIPMLFKASYVDSLSLLGESLQSNLVLFYRKVSSLYQDSIEIKMRYKAVYKPAIFFTPIRTNTNTFTSDQFGTWPYPYEASGFLYNLTDKVIIIDSVNYKFLGKNFTKMIYSSGDSLINFPYQLDTNKRLDFMAKMKILSPEISKCPLFVYCHYKDFGNSFVLHDTLSNIIMLDNSLSVRGDNFISAKIGDTVKLGVSVGVSNRTSKLWQLVKFSAFGADSQDINLNFSDSLPMKVEINKYKEILKPVFYCRKDGNYYIKFVFDFESEDGQKIQHTIVNNILVELPAGVEDNNYPENNSPGIYPNPAIDYIEISGAENAKAEIFNSLGSIVISSLGSDRIDVSSLPAGVYYVRMEGRVQKIVKVR